jgi:uncharacterized membrane protein YbhN (UPF0104 family)
MLWLRRILFLTGLAIGLGLLYYSRETLGTLDWSNPVFLLTLAGSVALWIALNILAGLAWHRLLGPFAPDLRTTVCLLLSTQIGKYLPGNIGQFLGRAVLGARYGVAVSALSTSMIIEVVLVLASAGSVMAIALALAPETARIVTDHLPETLPMPVLALAAAVLIGMTALILTKSARSPKGITQLFSIRNTTSAFVFYLGVFLINGAAFWLIALYIGADAGFLPILAIITTAFMAGFVTPGAPGGLGIREIVITAGLSQYLPPEAAASTAVLFRLVTVLGDVSAFGLGWLLLPPPRPE